MFQEPRLKHKICHGVLTVSAPDLLKIKQNKSETESEEDSLDDVLLEFESEKKKMSVNKNLLKERIPYFNGMFSNCFQESSQSVIKLDSTTNFATASKLIRFISKGSLKACVEDIQGIFVLTDLWGLEGIRNVCASFMLSEMDTSNCLELFQLGEMHSCDTLVARCKQLICQEFQIVCKSQAFLDLPSQLLTSILQWDGLNLRTCGEDLLMTSVMRWYHHDEVNRESSLVDVLKAVNMTQVSEDVVETAVTRLPVNIVKEIQSRKISCSVSNARCYKERFMVCCGYSQSRTGPTCPRTNSVELFDPDLAEFRRISFPEAPSYGVAFNLFGRIVFFAVYLQESENLSGRKAHGSRVYSYRSYADAGPSEWVLSPELFSPAAAESISECLVKEGCVVHCPEENCIYAVEIGRSACIQTDCVDERIFCNFKKELPPLQPHLDPSHSGLQAIYHRGRLFVLGGHYGPQMERRFSDDLLALTPEGQDGGWAWRRRRPMLVPRTGFAVASYGDKLVVSGGYGGRAQRRRHQTCECYDADSDTWEPFATMQQSRSGHCMVVTNGTLYVIGGKSYASQKLTTGGGWHPGGARIVSDFVEIYAEASQEWMRMARMHHARCNFCAVVL